MKHSKSTFTVFTAVLMLSLIFAASGFSQTTGTDTAYVPVVVNAADVEGRDVTNLSVSLKVQSPSNGERTYHLQAGKQETLALPLAGFVSVAHRPQSRQAYTPTTVTRQRGRVTLRLNPEQFQRADISLLSINGKRIWRGKTDVSRNTQNVSLPNIASGVYLLSVKGINGNTFATKLTHIGGKLSVSVAVGGADILSIQKNAFSANEAWTMTASTAFHNEVSRGFTPVSGTNEKIEIMLSAVSEYVAIYKAEWGLIEKSAHDDEETARANTANMQRAIDHFYNQGYRKMRLETMDITIWGAHPTGASSWGGSETQYFATGIVMRTGMFFDMNGSTFRLATNDRSRTAIVVIGVPNTEYAAQYGRVFNEPNPKINRYGEIVTTDVEIFNGTLIGDRITHDYWQPVGDGGKLCSHEYGTGIYIGSNTERVKVHNMVIKEITGDCIGIAGGSYHEIYNNTISRGRRNGIGAAAGWRGSINNVKIYGNTIFDIYNDVPIRGVVFNESGITTHQREQGITYGIGAQANIAFEGGHEYYGIHNIEIYDNHLDGKNAPWGHGDPINFHWATKSIHVRDNIIEGGIYATCGSYLIIERNKIFNGGIYVGGYGDTYNAHLNPATVRTGESDTRSIVVIDNYMQNSGVYLNSNPSFPNESGQEGTANVAFIGNHFVTSEIYIFDGVRAAIIGNRFNATVYKSESPLNIYSDISDVPRTQGTFVHAFINNLVQLRDNTKEDGTTPGWRAVRRFLWKFYPTFPPILVNGVLANPDSADAVGLTWYRETDDQAVTTAYLQGFGSVLGQNIIEDRYVFPLWTNWHTEFMKTHTEWYTKNADDANLAIFSNSGQFGGVYNAPYTLEEELQKYYQKAGHKNPQQ